MTALVSLSAGGAITGFSFVPKAAADLTSPTSMPIHLLALQQSAQAGRRPIDATLRSAIVNVAHYYLRMAAGQDPGRDGGDHLAARQHRRRRPRRVVRGVRQPDPRAGRPGGRPAELGHRRHAPTRGRCTSGPMSGSTPIRPRSASSRCCRTRRRIGRWHPLGDGYQPQPGDWVLFDGHVEVVTKYARRGAAHDRRRLAAELLGQRARVPGPLAGAGRGRLRQQRIAGPAARPAPRPAPASPAHGPRPVAGAGGRGRRDGRRRPAAIPARHRPARPAASPAGTGHGPARPAAAGRRAQAGDSRGAAGAAAGPGDTADRASQPAGRGAAPRAAPAQPARGHRAQADAASGPGRHPGAWPAPAGHGTGTGRPTAARAADVAATSGGAAIPGAGRRQPSTPGPARRRTAGTSRRPAPQPVGETAAQQAFINEVAPGAMAAQRRYGVPAAVTIAQAIDESGWGQSLLATQDHNLFGIKGTGPAGSDAAADRRSTRTASWSPRPRRSASTTTSPRASTTTASCWPTSGYYRQAMADRRAPERVRGRADRRVRHRSRATARS